MRRGHWRKGKEIHPNTQRSALMSANRPTTPAQVPLDTPRKDTKEGRKNQMQPQWSWRLGARRKRKIDDIYIYQFWALLCSCHPCEAKEKEKKRLSKHFFLQIISTKNLKKKRTQTPKQCHNSTHLAHLQLLPILARLCLAPLLAFQERVGEGGCRQRYLSASLPRTTLALTGAAEDWVQPWGRTVHSLDPGYPTRSHAHGWVRACLMDVSAR